MLKTIKIFIASSSELSEDRGEFRQFIGKENERLIQQNVFLQIVQWEHFLDAISDTRLQDEYNKAVCECDIVLCLFFTKVGKYTAEEFDRAYQAFKETGKPLIWTYFKDAPINARLITEEISTLLAFRKKISELGHFPTNYKNIDDLKIQFRDQLDKVLEKITRETETAVNLNKNYPSPPGDDNVKNVFNEKLTKRLIEAIQVYSPRAKKFLDNASRMAVDWETQPRFSDPAKEIIAFSFVGVLGIQLRKLMAIGKEEISKNKIRKYLENCQVTCKRALQLLCFSLISTLWDHKKENNYTLSTEQAMTCKNFFDDQFELDIKGFTNLLRSLISIFIDNNLSMPIAELKEVQLTLNSSGDFIKAADKLQAIEIDTANCTVADCLEAENNITTVLENLKFLANYRMVSIKNIGYFEMRNRKPHYIYNYTALGIDVKSNINQERVNYAEAPITTDAVLMYKGSYQENVNLFPFIIDLNALAFEGGAKIYFYSCRDNADGSLKYNFFEDNTVENIDNKETLKPGIDMNEVLMDPKKRKDLMLDSVFTLFNEAKKAVTGIEEEEDFSNPF